MKIGILGTGNVAQTLGAGFTKYGHQVSYGSRRPEAIKSDVGKVSDFATAAKSADLIVLAVKGAAGMETLRAAGQPALKGKTILDVTNPIADKPADNGVLHFFTDLEESLMERYQKAFPDAHFVKALNSVGAHLMVNADFGEVKPTMFMCGNDASAKAQVAKVLKQFGWEPADMGMVESARAIEPLCILWCIPSILGQGAKGALKLIYAK